MRISDWSSDVCSSDLRRHRRLSGGDQRSSRRAVAARHPPRRQAGDAREGMARGAGCAPPGGRRMSGPEEKVLAEKSLAELLGQDEAGAEDILAVLRLIAERAGKIILAYYVEAEEIEVRHKEDASPVTEADEAAEAFILGALNTLTPDIPGVAEEAMAAGEGPVIEDNSFWQADPHA